MSNQVVILGMNPKGFPDASFYADPPEDPGDEWGPCDGWISGKTGESVKDFAARIVEVWPGVQRQLETDEDGDEGD